MVLPVRVLTKLGEDVSGAERRMEGVMRGRECGRVGAFEGW